jgi:serine/threonine-protein kinase RsbW
MESHISGRTSRLGDDSEHFLRTAMPADAVVVTDTRKQFGTWLRTHFVLDDERFNDVLLAVNEALANAADHAYPSDSCRGTVDMAAVQQLGIALTITIVDHGTWRNPSRQRTERRGRGIPLMRALADRLSIDPSTHGTKVTMVWQNVPPLSLV